MNRANLARNLALSLTQGGWDRDVLEAALTRRLPRALHRLVPDMVKGLLTRGGRVYAPAPDVVADDLRLMPEFDRIYRYCLRRGVWPDPDLTPPAMAPTAAFAGLDVPQLPNVAALADWLLMSQERLMYLADVQGRAETHADDPVHNYHYTLLPKKTQGLRLIEAPKPALKAAQRQILRGILDLVPVHDDAFGFVPGRSCLQAAQRHAGEAVVVCFDLRDFFASVGYGRVFGLFRCLGYPLAVARVLCGLCTTRTPPDVLARLPPMDRALFHQPHLPQGAPTSPALANQVAFALDRRLAALARRLDAHYSRYADDLSFSGDRNITGVLLRAVPDIVLDEGLVLNAAKTRIMSAASRQVVTGVVVNQHLNVTRAYYDHLKAVIHACARPDDHRLADPLFRARLMGQVDWVGTVNPARGAKLQGRLAAALAVTG